MTPIPTTILVALYPTVLEYLNAHITGSVPVCLVTNFTVPDRPRDTARQWVNQKKNVNNDNTK
ncbi:hypothetical protein L873DRAFT_1819311 [Choiromyces venosus 120613-1]|uniref:Uncharacterized protein n=1 Tax=Choiromyces venosus 120613-1 TaxID=1336337 RepID=A0A3N4J4G1_9PEZI|nr:hypothetical protein L873DRAFT_1819311 [Choiromyces venosus 120613-1]